MALGRVLLGSAAAALTLGLFAPSAAQTGSAPTGSGARLASAQSFASEAASLRRQSSALATETEVLGAVATAQARAQALRQAALTVAQTGAAEAEAAASAASSRARADTQALEHLVMQAWFARAAGAEPSAQGAIRLAARQAAERSAPNRAAMAAAAAVAERRRAAAAALAAQTQAGELRLADASQRLAARSEDHAAILDRLALAESRARSLERDPDAAGRPAPRMAAALFGAGGARTVLGATDDRPGVVYAGAPGQLVVSPEGGHISFRGPLRGYGQVLIIEFDSGYSLVIAGLDHIRGAVGDDVRAGGVLGAFSASAAVAPELYVEVRRAARPVDPERAARSWSVAAIDGGGLGARP
jgi:septal ring factor EnvC (AmiA/AmiB activator)